MKYETTVHKWLTIFDTCCWHSNVYEMKISILKDYINYTDIFRSGH